MMLRMLEAVTSLAFAGFGDGNASLSLSGMTASQLGLLLVQDQDFNGAAATEVRMR